MNKAIFLKLFIALILLGIIGYLLYSNADQESVNFINKYHHQAKGQVEITIGEKAYRLFEAKTDVERNLGLSVFEEIAENEGMIFYFDKPSYYSMYMKNMKFDIDIIFLDKDWRVITIHEKVPVSSYRSDKDFDTFKAYSPSQYVIELASGEIEKNKIKVGDRVTIY